ncbi:carotenoid oxygenase family protein [Paraburkholderia xenovorans]|uniref:carotenoid oxygenase family protein n=1 Tax=Paraburkholderia xenovorans TaxID=36873 RepID=UPI0038BCB339
MNQRLNMNGYRANLQPIDSEVDRGPLPVRGELPSGLAGGLVRNGPNPFRPDPALHWMRGMGWSIASSSRTAARRTGTAG